VRTGCATGGRMPRRHHGRPAPETSGDLVRWLMIESSHTKRAVENRAYVSSEQWGTGGRALYGGSGRAGDPVGASAVDGRRGAGCRPDRWTSARSVRSSRRSGPAGRRGETSMPPRTHCRRRGSRRLRCGPSTRRKIRVRGWRLVGPGARRTSAAARMADANRREEIRSRAAAGVTRVEARHLFLRFVLSPDLAPPPRSAADPARGRRASDREIADALFVTEATLAQRISRAQAHLRRAPPRRPVNRPSSARSST